MGPIPPYIAAPKLTVSVRSSAPAPPAQQSRAQVQSTRGKVLYIERPHKGDELYAYLYQTAPNGLPDSNIERVEKEVPITDMRPVADDFRLDKNGVELHKLHVPGDIDWDNQEEVEKRYYPVAEELLQKATGATRVHVFDHTLRRGQLKEQDLDPKHLKADREGKPVGIVHVDYTAAGGLRRLHMLLPDEADKLQKTPFAIVQVWRPLRGPVQSSPLGVIDAATVDKKDLLSYRLEFPGRTGFNYGVTYNPDHRWYYAHGIDTNEAYVFVCYDSRSDRARFTPHTGFVDLSAAPDAPPRESVELRSICFFENEPPQEVAEEL